MKRNIFSVFTILCGLAVLPAAGCSSSNYITGIPPEAGAGITTDEYVFQVGDQFDVKFLDNPDYNATLIVRPDGRVSMNLANDILVAGMTPSELTELITQLYRDEIKDPKVTIILKQFAGQRIWIAGEVFNPGPVPLQGRMTVTQSIFGAGGPRNTALLDNVIVIRRNEETRESILYKVDVEKRLDGEKTSDFVLQPYDVVYVPKTVIAKVGDFVDLYINKPVPDWMRLGFTYRIDSTNPSRKVNIYQ